MIPLADLWALTLTDLLALILPAGLRSVSPLAGHWALIPLADLWGLTLTDLWALISPAGLRSLSPLAGQWALIPLADLWALILLADLRSLIPLADPWVLIPLGDLWSLIRLTDVWALIPLRVLILVYVQTFLTFSILWFTCTECTECIYLLSVRYFSLAVSLDIGEYILLFIYLLKKLILHV